MSLSFEERFGATDIARRVKDVARRIAGDYPSGPVVLVSILKGTAFFAADLARALSPKECRIEYVDVFRGQDEEVIDLHFVRNFRAAGADIVILKDVVRSGTTERYLSDQFREENPRSIRFASIVDRPQERKLSFVVDYVLFPSEEGVLVGYGMEYQGEGGHFPFIAQVKTGGEGPEDPPTGRIRTRP